MSDVNFERDSFEAWYIAGVRKAVPAFAEWSDSEIREGCMRPENDSYRIDSARIALEAWQARAALAATQATGTVVLPEPERFMDDRGYTVEAKWLKSDDATSDYRNVYTQPLFTEPQVRALLATGAGLRTQAGAQDAVGFSPMWFAPLNGTPVLLYFPTTSNKFAVGQWHGHVDRLEGNWGDDEGNFYVHMPVAFMSLRNLSGLADRSVPEEVRAAIAEAKEGAHQGD